MDGWVKKTLKRINHFSIDSIEDTKIKEKAHISTHAINIIENRGNG